MARYRRYLIKDENLLVVRGSIGPVIAGLHEYNSRHGIPLHRVSSILWVRNSCRNGARRGFVG